MKSKSQKSKVKRQCPFCFSCVIKYNQPRIRRNDKLAILTTLVICFKRRRQNHNDHARKTVTNGWHMFRFFEKFLFDRQFLKIYLMYEGQIRQLDCLMLHLRSIKSKNISPKIHHDSTAFVKSTAGVVWKGDVASLSDISVTLWNLQQQLCSLHRNWYYIIQRSTQISIELTSLALVEL